MREEYTRDNYPSFGKKYAGERGVISLTSWKARIDTVSKTLYSLLKQCPGFHIVLVLSEEEFPKMMDEMPASLKLFVKNDLIEVLWVYKNYKAFKKVLFTMDKYRDVPVISADDDCIYIRNYAQELYDEWEKNRDCIITAQKDHRGKYAWSRGPATLFRPYCFFEYGLKFIEGCFKNPNDDAYLCALKDSLGIQIIDTKIGVEKKVLIFHDTTKALSKQHAYTLRDFDFFNKLVKVKS